MRLIINGKMPGWDAGLKISIAGSEKNHRADMQKHLLFTFSAVPEPEVRAVSCRKIKCRI